jgi:nitroreductase
MTPLADELRACVAAATQAPSIHNTQPWRFVVHQTTVELHADPRRQLPESDRMARAVHISCGAALLNLRLAIAAQGRQARVRLLPDRDAPTHLATVRVGGPRRASEDDPRLAQAIWTRHTSREPFSDRRLPDPLRAALVDAAGREGGLLRFLDEDERAALLSMVRTAEARQRCDAAYRDELARWTGGDGMRADGIPVAAFGSRSVMEIVPLRDFAAGQRVVRRVVRFETDPTIALLSTVAPGNQPRDWVRAGMALERVLLEATASGLATSLMTQPMGIAALRDLLAEHTPLEAPQVILRLGFGRPGAETPRRPLDEVVDTSP